MDMKWHANAHVQHSAKEEADQFWWGKHIDLKINKSINANIKLRKLQLKSKENHMVLFLYLLIICYQAQFLAQHCVLELAQYEAVFTKTP